MLLKKNTGMEGLSDQVAWCTVALYVAYLMILFLDWFLGSLRTTMNELQSLCMAG